MPHSFLNLLLFTWKYLVSLLGINILSFILFSIFIPILVFIVHSYYEYKQSRNGVALPQIIKRKLLSPPAIITGVVYLAVLLLLLSWGITYTTYKDHEDLKGRIRIINKERDDYKQLSSNRYEIITERDDEIKKLKAEKKSVATTNIVPSVLPKPMLSGLRIASQKQFPSDDPNFPFGLSVIIQTDTVIEPVWIAVLFNGELGKGDAYMGSGAYIYNESSVNPKNPTIFIIKWQSPAFTPTIPIILNVYSQTYVQAIEIKRR